MEILLKMLWMFVKLLILINISVNWMEITYKSWGKSLQKVEF